MPSDSVVEFGGWPRPPQWVRAVAGVVAAAVLTGAIIAHTRSHHAAQAPASKSRAAATAPLRGRPVPAGGAAARWPSAAGTCGPVAYLPQIRLAQQHAGSHVRVLIVAQSCGKSAATALSH
jgi:hypothetical protein